MTTPKFLKAPISSLKKKGLEMVATKENIRAAYIAPIKSVVCIDDDFPTFAEILGEEKKCSITKEEVAGDLTDPDSNPFSPKTGAMPTTKANTNTRHNAFRDQDKQRVLELIKSCHREGYLVDIQNDYPDSEGSFIAKADLLVLDYEFSGTPHKTLLALQKLAENPDYNLVIVYTQENTYKAAIQTASCLWEIQPDIEYDCICSEAQTLASDNLPKLLENENGIFARLSRENRISQKILEACAQTIKNECFGITPINGYIESCKLTDSSSKPWIACRNLFLVFISKDQNIISITELLNSLCDSLYAHSPTPMTLMMHHAVSDLKKNINAKMDRLLPNKETKAVALFASLKNGFSKDNEIPEEYVIDYLLRSLFYSARRALSEDTYKTVSQYIKDIKLNSHSYKSIAKQEKVKFDSPELFYAVLNYFICCESHYGDFLTTGSIFRIEKNGENVYYVCVSPECSLVERDSQKILTISAVEFVKHCATSRDILNNIHKNRHYIFYDNTFICGEIITDNIYSIDFFLHIPTT